MAHNLFFTLYNSKDTFNKRFKYYILIIIVVPILLETINISTGGNGYNSIGLCWINYRKWSVTCLIFTGIIIFPFIIFAIIYSYKKEIHKKKLNRSHDMPTEVKYQFVKANIILLTIFLIIWMPIYVINILDYYFDIKSNDYLIWEIFNRIAFILICSHPYLIFLGRLNEKIFKNSFINVVKQMFYCCFQSDYEASFVF